MKWTRSFLAVLVVLLIPTVGFAWEFQMTGYYEQTFSYLSRVGPGDLFGNTEAAQALTPITPGLTTIGLSGPVNGVVSPEGLSSKGSDGSWLMDRFVLYPTLKITPAIKLNTIVGIQGSLNGPYQGGVNWTDSIHRWGSYNINSRSESIWDPMAAVLVRAAWAQIETPIARIEFGRRPFGFGLGWSGFSKEDYADTSLAFTIPYGPLSFLAAVNLTNTGEQTDPYDSRDVNLTPRTVVSSVDRNEIQTQNWYVGTVYTNGPLEIGVLGKMTKYQRVHAFPNAGLTLRDDQTASFAAMFLSAFRNSTGGGGGAGSSIPIYGDVTLVTVPIYMKYFDGRFFFNAEYDFQRLYTSRDGGRPISGSPNAWMLELGGLAGPARLSLAAFWRSGHDRQGGLLDTSSASGSTGTATQVGDSWLQYIGGAGNAVEPYNWILGWYGTGNNSYDAVGRPIYTDFKAFAGRFDYAVAANLNVWASYIYANRASNTGSWWGQYNGGVGTVPVVRGNNVADDNLGWEADVGTSWKLLENLTWEFKFGYWKPGDWFKTAYQNLGSTNTLASGAFGAQSVPVDPNRSIDPIIGLQSVIRIDF